MKKELKNRLNEILLVMKEVCICMRICIWNIFDVILVVFWFDDNKN